MPVNHGIYRKHRPDRKKGERVTVEDWPVFRYGILNVFEAMKRGPFLSKDADKKRASQLHYHFLELCQRLVFGLQNLNMLMQEMAHELSTEQIRPGQMALGFQAGYHADHIPTYLNTLVDDVAQIIILVTGSGHLIKRNEKKGNPIESMNDLKHLNIRSDVLLAPVTTLLADLDTAAWWKLAFETKAGARQLIIHNQYLVTFQGAKSDGQPYEAQA